MSTNPPADAVDPDAVAARLVARRTVVVGGAVASAALLAACSTSSTAVLAPTTAASPPAGGGPSSSPGGGEAGGATVLGPVEQVPVGAGALFDAGGQPVMVTQPSAGTFHGFSAVCPHEGCVCNVVDQGVIVCPCHGSTFSIESGDVLTPPARSGLQQVDVAVQGSDIVLV